MESESGEGKAERMRFAKTPQVTSRILYSFFSMVKLEAPSCVVRVSVVGGIEYVLFEGEEATEEDSSKSNCGQKVLRRSPIMIRAASEYEKGNYEYKM